MIARGKEKNLTSAGIETTTSGFDRPLLNRLSYEARWEQVGGGGGTGDYDGNCGNVNVKGTNGCCAAGTNGR